MKRVAVYLFVLAVLAAGGFSCPVLADSTATYSITGSYGTGTQTTALTAAGQSFAMSFSLPTNPASLIVSNVLGDDFYVYPLSVTYTFEGATSTLTNTLVAFYVAAGSQAGGFLVDHCVDVTCATNLEYQWEFQGPQQYTGSENNPTIVPTGFLSNGQQLTIFNNDTNTFNNGFFDSTVNGTAVNTPEPSSLLLLGAGLAGIGLLVKSRG